VGLERDWSRVGATPRRRQSSRQSSRWPYALEGPPVRGASWTWEAAGGDEPRRRLGGLRGAGAAAAKPRPVLLDVNSLRPGRLRCAVGSGRVSSVLEPETDGVPFFAVCHEAPAARPSTMLSPAVRRRPAPRMLGAQSRRFFFLGPI
jgi:hypothetical protein